MYFLQNLYYFVYFFYRNKHMSDSSNLVNYQFVSTGLK